MHWPKKSKYVVFVSSALTYVQLTNNFTENEGCPSCHLYRKSLAVKAIYGVRTKITHMTIIKTVIAGGVLL